MFDIGRWLAKLADVISKTAKQRTHDAERKEKAYFKHAVAEHDVRSYRKSVDFEY
jgi:hypothetical protein